MRNKLTLVNPAELEEYHQFAQHLLDSTRHITTRLFEQLRDVTCKDDTSIVTEADRAIESFIRSEIAQHYPTHGIVGEECGEMEGKSKLSWLIDPIDGTKAFVAGYPTFCTLLGLLYKGEPVMGLVDQPLLARRWSSLEEPEYKTTIQQKPMVATTSLDFLTPTQTRALMQWKHDNHIQMMYGGDAYAYMMLLDGRISAVFDIELKPYDILPLLPILYRDPEISIIMLDSHLHPTEALTGNIVATRDETLATNIIETLKHK